MDSLNNEDDMSWFSSAQPNEDTETAMTDDIKPDILLENQRIAMLQVEDFLNNSESDHAVEDEYGSTVVGGSAQGESSDTSSQKKDILMLDEEVSQHFFPEFLRRPRHMPPLITWNVSSYVDFGYVLHVWHILHAFLC